MAVFDVRASGNDGDRHALLGLLGRNGVVGCEERENEWAAKKNSAQPQKNKGKDFNISLIRFKLN